MKIAGRDIKIFNLVVCIAGIAILLLAGIYPSYRTLSELDREIAKLETDIAGQKLLFPVFIELLKRSREKSPPLLPAPTPEKLPRGDTSRLASQFREIAADNRITVSRLNPNVESLIDAAGRLKMEAELSGDFQDLRQFLIQIGSVPYLESVEYLRLEASPGREPLTVTLRFWVLQG
ncbi:MAG: hypothetical protein PVG78_02210 [Desulfobacterales bacterium]|jgi:hypothetical protein